MMECRSIPGNIGLVRSRVSLYSHNPFWARPYQNFTYPFTKTAGAEIAGIESKSEDDRSDAKDSEDKQNVIFQFGEAYLKPSDFSFSNFVATIKEVTNEARNVERKLDIVKGIASSSEIKEHLPGGDIYNNAPASSLTTGKYVFPHQLWIYQGSAIYETDILHPSDYATAAVTSTPESVEDMAEGARARLLLQKGYAIWDMAVEKNPKEEKQINRVYPKMVGRRTCRTCAPIHWTVRKFTPLFQGQDFSLEFMKVDAVPNDWAMITDDPIQELTDNPMEGSASDSSTPFYPFFEPAWKGFQPTGWSSLDRWENGVSNASSYLHKDEEDEEGTDAIKNHIKANYMKNKAYVIVELGVGQWNTPIENNDISRPRRPREHEGENGDGEGTRNNHNYFIEFVRGRSPRFLHLGLDYRGFDGKGPDGTYGYKTDVIYKLRVLSEFDKVSVDSLMAADKLKFSVRQHLGDLIITFDAHKDIPWRITRRDYYRNDNERESEDEDAGGVAIKRVPMVIPYGPMRIHGGNMTVCFAYNPMIYEPTGQVVFRDRQADVKDVENHEIYATFAHPGDNDRQRNPENSRSKRRGYFTDLQFRNLKMGYDADAYEIYEIHKNQIEMVPVYEIFQENYKRVGRQWAHQNGLRNVAPSPMIEGWRREIASTLYIEVVKNTQAANPTFNLAGVPENIMGSDGEYVGMWDVLVGFRAGYHGLTRSTSTDLGVPYDIPTTDTDDNDIGDGWLDGNHPFVMPNNITPIATAWSLIVLGGGKVIKDSMREDISEFVESIGDGWSAEGFSSMNHETKLQLYLPISTGWRETDSKVSRILSLMDRTFFVTIAYWWEHGMGLDTAIQSAGNRPSHSYPPDDDPRLIQMTGMAYGAEVERTVNKVRMSVNVKDYMEPLKQAFVWNCPFFDSVSDTAAVYELAKMAGLDNSIRPDDDVPGQQSVHGIDRRPLGFLQELMQTRVDGISEPVIYNEEKHVHDYFALPGTYADLNNPAMRFPNGTPYKDIMERLIKLYGKTIYFDRYGVLIVEVSAAKLTAFRRVRVDPNDPDAPLFDVDVEELIKAAFVTTPRTMIWDVEEREFVPFDSQVHTPFLVYNAIKFKRSVADAINHISMFSVSAPDSGTTGFMAKGRTFYEQMWEPESEGFFGFRKMMWHQDGIYGNDRSMNSAMTFYARFKYPPFAVSFETYGVPGLKPFDVIMLDNQPLYITEINHDIDPKTNTWWMSVSTEWIKSFDDKLLFPPISEQDIARPDV